MSITVGEIQVNLEEINQSLFIYLTIIFLPNMC